MLFRRQMRLRAVSDKLPAWPIAAGLGSVPIGMDGAVAGPARSSRTLRTCGRVAGFEHAIGRRRIPNYAPMISR